MSESIPTILKLAVAMVLIVGLIAAGSWAMGLFNEGVGDIDTKKAGTFQPG